MTRRSPEVVCISQAAVIQLPSPALRSPRTRRLFQTGVPARRRNQFVAPTWIRLDEEVGCESSLVCLVR